MQPPDLQRIEALEKEVRELQKALRQKQGHQGHRHSIARLLKAVVSNWVLLSFLSAILIAGYAKFIYGHEFLKQYRVENDQQNIAKVYNQLGHLKLARAKWDDAHQAYEKAQQFDPYNPVATVGMLESDVFRAAGESGFRSDVVPTLMVLRDVTEKLSGHHSDVGENGCWDDQSCYLEGLLAQSNGDNLTAIKRYERAIQKNKDSTASYFQLGGIYSFEPFNIGEAIKNSEKAADLNSGSWEALSNLGYEYFLKRDFDHSKEKYDQSLAIFATWENTFEMAEWYRYNRNPKMAKSLDEEALRRIQGAKSQSDPYLANYATWNFMPRTADDEKTIRCYVATYEPMQKMAFVNYALSLDSAMMGNFEDANKQRADALRLDSDREYAQYFAEMSGSVGNLCKVSEHVHRWLGENSVLLAGEWRNHRDKTRFPGCEVLR
jgi:tetratricopeptide (TPR) repeat protein